MQAIGYNKNGPIDAPESLIEFDAPMPAPKAGDLLVEVRGVSVNPVDVKVRAKVPPEHGTKIIGYDAAGVVKDVGSAVKHFKIGDEVFYAGDITRPGTNSAFHLVDERIAGNKPKSLDFAEAAGMPLTSITAWELLFDCLCLAQGEGRGDDLLVIGGAGGVGSILIQLAKQLTGLTVVATASRPETSDWVKKMGADHVVNHRESLVAQLDALGRKPRYVAALTGTDGHFPAILELVKPRGHVAVIDDPATLDILPAKRKALSFSWEFMFSRPMHQTDDMDKQRELLNQVAQLLDDGTLVSTVTGRLGRLNAENLREAHRLQESGRVIGKNVLEGF